MANMEISVHLSLHADLSGGFNAPDETEEDHEPGYSQAAQDGETDLSKVTDIIRDVQHVVPDTDRWTNRDRVLHI